VGWQGCVWTDLRDSRWCSSAGSGRAAGTETPRVSGPLSHTHTYTHSVTHSLAHTHTFNLCLSHTHTIHAIASGAPYRHSTARVTFKWCPREEGAQLSISTETGSFFRLIDSWNTQLKAQGPSRTCTRVKKEKREEETRGSASSGDIPLRPIPRRNFAFWRNCPSEILGGSFQKPPCPKCLMKHSSSCRANVEEMSQSRSDSGLGLSYFKCHSLRNRVKCSLPARKR
jgi:hypothetical protein